jgi:hypothetical protein
MVVCGLFSPKSNQNFLLTFRYFTHPNENLILGLASRSIQTIKLLWSYSIMLHVLTFSLLIIT